MTKTPPIYVIYHRGCPDGMAAAFAASTILGDTAHYIPRTHTDAPPRFRAGSIIYFVDIALPREQMIELAKTALKIVVLDHHVTAQNDLVDLPDNVEVVFDMERSGAQIAWAYFRPETPEPKVITHIADRDLWRFQLPNTREITEAVMAHEYDLSVYDSMITEPLLYARLKTQGEAILMFKENALAQLIKEARTGEIYLFEEDGDEPSAHYFFPVCNAPHFFASDLAHALLLKYPKAPFAACYRDTASGRRDWSLRSLDDRVDVSHIAQMLNRGGGHRNAAGFSEERAEQHVFMDRGAYTEPA